MTRERWMLQPTKGELRDQIEVLRDANECLLAANAQLHRKFKLHLLALTAVALVAGVLFGLGYGGVL